MKEYELICTEIEDRFTKNSNCTCKVRYINDPLYEGFKIKIDNEEYQYLAKNVYGNVIIDAYIPLELAHRMIVYFMRKEEEL